MTNGSLSYNSGLVGKIIRFSNFLRGYGFKVSHSNVEDAVRGIGEIDPSVRDDFLTTLRANLVKNDIEWVQFKDLFDKFWNADDDLLNRPPNENDVEGQKSQDSNTSREIQSDTATTRALAESKSNVNKIFEETVYSPLSVRVEKDFTCFDRTDIPLAQQLINNIIQPFRIHESRRLIKSKKPWDIDFRRVMQKSLKYEGLPLELFFRGKKRKLKHLIFLIDVSGSMDRYARLVLPFILSLRKVGSKAEVFVFSTSLASITIFVRHMNMDQIFEHIAQHVPDWSGGTRIGHSLQQFNRNQGRKLRKRQSVIVILSDGWDLGEQDLLKQEMLTLNRNADTIIWLNPLAGDPDYQPLCQGMRTALPFIDFFLPAASLDSLKKAGHLIHKIMTR